MGYHPKDAESCKSRVASTPDYWCADMCKGEGGCPKSSCACDGDDPNEEFVLPSSKLKAKGHKGKGKHAGRRSGPEVQLHCRERGGLKLACASATLRRLPT